MSIPTDREIEDMAEELRAERRASMRSSCRGFADERGPCGNDDCATCHPFQDDDNDNDDQETDQ